MVAVGNSQKPNFWKFWTSRLHISSFSYSEVQYSLFSLSFCSQSSENSQTQTDARDHKVTAKTTSTQLLQATARDCVRYAALSLESKLLRAKKSDIKKHHSYGFYNESSLETLCSPLFGGIFETKGSSGDGVNF